jgi:hypothetical protein
MARDCCRDPPDLNSLDDEATAPPSPTDRAMTAVGRFGRASRGRGSSNWPVRVARRRPQAAATRQSPDPRETRRLSPFPFPAIARWTNSVDVATMKIGEFRPASRLPRANPESASREVPLMPSPFPGMDPYLEQDDVWHDFHERSIPLVASLLGSQLRPRYIVKIDEHIYVRELAAEPRRFVGRADVSLGRGSRRAGRKPAPGAATGLLEAPLTVRLPAVDRERLGFVEVRDRRNRELVTVIEMLSPANKQTGPDREQYLAKRMEILNGPVHLVEIDLLRGGPPMPADGRPDCSYSVLVSRAERRLDAEFWPISLRERLPEIPIPVRPSDSDARLDLQAVLDRVYDDAGYADYIYEGSPRPRLGKKDAEWARRFVP